MSYPGDQQQPGGWAPSQPPQSPYGPADDQAASGGSPFGFAPHGDASPDSGFGSFGAERQPDPYGSPYDNGPSSFSEPPGDDAPAPGRKRLVIGAAVVAGVVVVGGGTALALTSGGGGGSTGAASPTATPPAATPTVNPTPSPTETGRGERLRSRATDPAPLKLSEVFKNRSFKVHGRKYVMTARRAETKCAPPTHGVKFRKAIAKAGCTQVLRATFSDGKFVGTIGVVNLRAESDANTAQGASRQKDAYIVPLPGAGSTKKIGQGLSLTTAEVDGHYLVLSWVQYPTGKQIAKGDYAAVTTFVRSTTYGSNLRPALNYRSMEGKPS